MPQPKSGATSRKRTTTRPKGAAAAKPAAAKPAAAKPAAARSAAKPAAARSAAKPAAAKRAAKPAAARSAAKPAAAKRAAKPAAAKGAAKPAAAKGAAKPAAAKGAARPAAAKTGARRPAAARKPAATATNAGAGDEQLRQNLAQLRDTLAQAVVIPAERVQAVIDEARQGGHIAPRAAQDLAGSLLTAGRKQADDLRAQVEALVGRGRGQTDDLVSKVTKGAREATRRATQAGDPVLRQVDRVRRRTAPTSFPITAYDELGVAQVRQRLAELTKPQLRKVRTYEAKNANRKSVLGAIDKALG